jgi:hypothetical protein
MNLSRSKIVLILSAAIVLVAIPPGASFYQDNQRSYSPEGAHLCSVDWDGPEGPMPPFPYMDIYTSDSNNPGFSGTILCTLSVKNFTIRTGDPQNPAWIQGNMTEAAQGNWIRIGKNRFAMTTYRILTDADGKPVGTDGKPLGIVKFWGTVTVVGEGELSGTLNAEYYDSEGRLFRSLLGGISTGKRIEVEAE